MAVPTLNAVAIRRLADRVASWRGSTPNGDPMYAVAVTQGGPYELGFTSAPGPNALFEVDTDYVAAGRPCVTAVNIQADGMSTLASLLQYDAVFWSEAAVEKFVIPYYASKNLWLAGYVLQKLSKAWYGRLPTPSNSGDRPDVSDSDPVPFAMAHLPGSDYVGVGGDQEPDPGIEDLYLLFMENGVVRHEPLSKYL
jgi:hypothetical protein